MKQKALNYETARTTALPTVLLSLLTSYTSFCLTSAQYLGSAHIYNTLTGGEYREGGTIKPVKKKKKKPFKIYNVLLYFSIQLHSNAF